MRHTLAYYSDSTTFGGTERVIISLLQSLDRQQWSPILLCPASSGIDSLVAAARQLDVPVYQVPGMREGLDGARRVPRFAHLLRSLRPDIFHAHLTWSLSCKYGLTSAVLAGVPAVMATQHLYIDAPLKRSQAIQHRLLMSRLNHVTAVSRGIAGHLVNDLHLPQALVTVIHNGISLSPLATSDSGVAPQNRPPTVLVPARLDPQKGHRVLLRAAQMLPGVMFLLAGDGLLRSELQQMAATMGIADRIQFLGFRADMATLYHQCDVVCLASLYEGLPLSILEAMAASKPVVASCIPGIDEIVLNGESGILVEPGDSRILAGALDCLLRNPARAAQLGARGRRRVEEEFSTQSMAARYSALYDSVLARLG